MFEGSQTTKQIHERAGTSVTDHAIVMPLTEDSKPESSGGWLVVWTESRAEKKVLSRIAAKGMDAWLPTIRERRRWSDRWREVVLPLFPGYLFARCDPSDVGSLLQTPGVLTVVKTGTRPAQLSDGFVRRLRDAVESSATPPEPVPAVFEYQVQQEVIIHEGPLAGLRGVVRQVRGGRQLVIWIAEIGRGVALTIEMAFVTHAPSSERR